jgi:uncharacterized protein (DUF58 family)
VLSRRYHFSIASFAYIATTCVLVIGAVNGQNNLLFWIFGLAVAGLLISGVLSGWSLMGIHIRRRIIAPSAAGEAFRVEYTIRNTNFLFGAFGLLIEELPEGRNWFGRRFGADWHRHVAPLKTSIPYVPARGTVVVEGTALALRRGPASFGPLRVSSTFPFGITRKSVTLHQPDAALVRPQRVELAPSIKLAGGEARAESRALVRARAGDDMFALRDYQAGDSPRAIAWRATARADRPIVRDPAIRRGRRVWLVLDDASGTPESRERAISLAAALLERGIREGAQVGLIAASHGVLLPAGPLAPSRLAHTVDQLAALPVGQPEPRASQHAPALDALAALPIHDGRLSIGGKPLHSGEHFDPTQASCYRNGALPDLPPDPDEVLASRTESLASAIASAWSALAGALRPRPASQNVPAPSGGPA